MEERENGVPAKWRRAAKKRRRERERSERVTKWVKMKSFRRD